MILSSAFSHDIGSNIQMLEGIPVKVGQLDRDQSKT